VKAKGKLALDDVARARGRLSIVATPIGNLDDITLRALATLRAAHVILAEDTRQTRKLLGRHAIAGKLRALHAHSSDTVIERCLEELAAGQRLALVTDAGTPLISDPGGALVQAASERGTEVESIPGPSAVTAALSVCGVPFDVFRFLAFAPRSGEKRKLWLQQIAGDPAASVFFESPVRLPATLTALAERLHPQRMLAVCRELTKVHEEVVRGTAQTLSQHFATGTRGEITVVVGAGPTVDESATVDQAVEIEPLIRTLLAQGLSPRDVARRLARESGLARRQVYARVQAARAALSREPP
jgi:16S rRNA (cytidine1402-2'-O)-methyltransferase